MQKTTITFEGLMTIPVLWRGFFKMSEIGNTYTVLTDDNNRLVMTDTEFEHATNQPLFDAVQEKIDDENIEQVDVLLLGWGIGFVIPHITNPKVKIHVIEKYQEVLDLTPPDEGIEVYVGDINGFNFTQFENKKFDVIWSDVTDHNAKEFAFRSYLKPRGKFMFWKSWIE